MKGDDYLMKLVNNYYDKAQYYGNMKPRFKKYYEEDLEECVSLLHHFEKVSSKYNRTELNQLIDDRLTGLLGRYYME